MSHKYLNEHRFRKNQSSAEVHSNMAAVHKYEHLRK